MKKKDADEILEKITKYLDKRHAMIQEKVCSELAPFLDDVTDAPPTSRKFSIFKQSFLEFMSKYESKRKVFASIMDVKSLPSATDRVGQLYMLFLYLGAVESIGNAVVDMLVMLLVANEIDFHIECRHATPRIKHVDSIRDLEKERIPLTTKLNFLRDNGICEVAEIMDSQLRNDIAHLNFQVKENEILIRNRETTELLMTSLTDLWAGIECAAGFLYGSAEEMGIVGKREHEEKSSK